jgi:hypothetical protein
MKKTPLEKAQIKVRMEDIGLYRKKSQTSSKSDSKKRTDHKHKYESVIIVDRVFTAIYWGKRCSICGRIQERICLTPDRDFVKPEARNKNRQRISAKELMSIPEIRDKYPGIEIVGVEEDLPAEEEIGKNND